MLFENVKQCAEKKGLSMNKLEAQAGLARNTICKWGTSVPSVDKVAAVAAVLDTTIDELMKE